MVRGVNEVVSFKTFNTIKTGKEALSVFEQTLKKSATALNEAVLDPKYSKANKVLDIVVKKGKFDLTKLDDMWDLLKGSYPNIKKVNIYEF